MHIQIYMYMSYTMHKHYVYDDVTYVYDDVTYVYDDVTYVYDMYTSSIQIGGRHVGV